MIWNDEGSVVDTLGTFMQLRVKEMGQIILPYEDFVITERWSEGETSDYDEDPNQYMVGNDAGDIFTEMGGYPVLHPEETGALYYRGKYVDCECVMRTAFGYVRPVSGEKLFWYREDQATLCAYCNPQLELDL